MNKTDLYNFTVGLLDGNSEVADIFDTLLDTAQSNRENARPWTILRTEDSTQTVDASTTFTTPINLPSDFRKWYTRFPVVLTDAQGNVIKMLRQIPINLKNAYKDDDGKFYVDYTLGKIYICGTRSQSCTVRQYYIKKTTKVSADNSNTWFFSTYDDGFDKILAFDIAAMFKLGVDYDIINAAQANNNAATAELIFRMMSEWDNELALSAQQGVDFGTGIVGGFTDTTGSVRNLLG